jgi:hypothetical protein
MAAFEGCITFLGCQNRSKILRKEVWILRISFLKTLVHLFLTAPIQEVSLLCEGPVFKLTDAPG